MEEPGSNIVLSYPHTTPAGRRIYQWRLWMLKATIRVSCYIANAASKIISNFLWAGGSQ